MHLHILLVAKNMAYLNNFHRVLTKEAKIEMLENYVREHLDIRAHILVDKNHRRYLQNSPLGKQYVDNIDEDTAYW